MNFFREILIALQGRWSEVRDTRKNWRTTDAGQGSLNLLVQALIAIVVIIILLWVLVYVLKRFPA